jgi:hypothetical protein
MLDWVIRRKKVEKGKKRPGVLSSSSAEADADIEDDDGIIVETDYYR